MKLLDCQKKLFNTDFSKFVEPIYYPWRNYDSTSYAEMKWLIKLFKDKGYKKCVNLKK